METKDMVSIIVPVYQVEDCLPQCIESILTQTYQNIELILVDDGSPDNCGAICDSYAEKDDRIRVIHKENNGVSAARNAALEIAAGEFLAFVDGDDEIEPTMIEVLYQNLIKYQCDISVCGIWFVFPDGTKKRACAEDMVEVYDRQAAMENILLGKYYAGHLCNKMFRRTVFANQKLDPAIKVYEDSLVVAEVILQSERLVFDSTPLYRYLLRDDSAYRKAFSPSQYTAFFAFDKIKTLLLENNLPLLDCLKARELFYSVELLCKLAGEKGEEAREYRKKIRKRMGDAFSFSAINRLGSLAQKCFVLGGSCSPALMNAVNKVRKTVFKG